MTYLKKSPWIIHYDASSCNGCDIEVLAALTPLYDVERFGIVNTGNPKHADIFLVTGSVNEQNRQVLINTYEQIPDPKVVVAIGICATSGGIFRECYNVMGGIDKVIPVDVYVTGCAARRNRSSMAWYRPWEFLNRNDRPCQRRKQVAG